MGDIKRLRKKYSTPAHPWISADIEEAKKLKADYGLLRRKEILIASSFLKKYKDLAKKLIADPTAQGKKEAQQLMGKLRRLGMLSAGAQLEDVLSLSLTNVLERRLQTQVFRKKLSRSMKQARQFITHRHIAVGDCEITSPSYLVAQEEEGRITFKGRSPLAAEGHPERAAIAEIDVPAAGMRTAAASTVPAAKRVEAVSPSEREEKSTAGTESAASTEEA